MKNILLIVLILIVGVSDAAIAHRGSGRKDNGDDKSSVILKINESPRRGDGGDDR